MKRITIIAILIAAALTASAQGEWKWAHCWSGSNGINSNDYYNRITVTAFDDEGNLYVYGTMGGTAAIDNELLAFSEDSRVLLTNNPAILLAKFDTLGNMLWYKVVKQSSESALPKWMEVREDRIFIAGDCGFGGDSHHEWLYYMDTLIEESQITALPDSLQKPPFKKYSRWTFFAILDLDGNLLADRFVEAFSREYYEPVHLRWNHALCVNSFTNPAPLHVDRDGNWYIFTPFCYQGVESDPYTVVVYGDSDKVYDLYLPGNIDASTPSSTGFFNAMLYKFSPNWDLLSAKLLVNHSEGMTSIWPNGGDSIKCHVCCYEGLSFDEDDNMYLSGHVEVNPCYASAGGLLHHYPVYIYWDSTHRLVVHDITSAQYGNFILKYDTAGNVVWCNQLHTKGYVYDDVPSAIGRWTGNSLYDNSIYIAGNGSYNIDDSTLVYFDDESIPLQHYGEINSMHLSMELTETTGIGFFVRYDKNTGAYVSQGVVPAMHVRMTRSPGVVNNRVFAFAGYGYVLENTNLFVEWQNDGTFIKADSVDGALVYHRSAGTIASERGYVATALQTENTVRFSDEVMADCHNGSNNTATFAMYYDPDIVNGIPERENKFLSVKLWPNPTANTLSIECEGTSLERLSVLDLTGRTVLRQSVDGFHSQIDVSSLPAGMYLLEVVSDGRKQYEKFVKSAE